MGDSLACKQILEGTYQPPVGVDKYIYDFLLELKKPPQLMNTLKASISTQQF